MSARWLIMRERLAAPGLRVGLIGLLLALAMPALAHKLSVFALAEGATIRGQAYFAGRSPAQGVAVSAFAPDGRLLATTTTDAQGRFAMPVAARVDHRLVVDSGDGHAAEYVVRASELALSPAPPVTAVSPLSRLGEGEAGPSAGAPGAVAPAETIAVAPAASATTGADVEALEAALDRALSRQLGPLREQLAETREQVMWRDVLGGVGYILGLTGIACWCLARRRVEAGRRTLRRQNDTL